MTTHHTGAGEFVAGGLDSPRSLYLARGAARRIGASEGALVVGGAGPNKPRFPSSRVARVVVADSKGTDWSGAAIVECLAKGISITWLDANGQPLGAAFPAVGPSGAGFAAALEHMLEHPAGLAAYEAWLRSRRMQVLMDVANASAIDGAQDAPLSNARQDGTALGGVTPRQWETIKREWVYNTHVDVHLPARLHGNCMAQVNSQLAAHQLSPWLLDPDGHTVRLDRDLFQLLWAELNLGSGGLVDAAHDERSLAAWFEAWYARHAGGLVLHLSSLRRCALRFSLP